MSIYLKQSVLVSKDRKEINISGDLLLILLIFLVSFLGISLSYYKIGLIIIYFFALILSLLILLRRTSLAYLLLIIIVVNLSEYSKFITQEGYYSFRTVGIYGISFTTIFIFILALDRLFISKNRIISFKSYFTYYFLVIFIIGILIGFYNIIWGYSSLHAFLGDLGYCGIFIISFYISLTFYNNYKIGKIIFLSIMIMPITGLISWLFFSKGNYGGAPIAFYDSIGYVVSLIPSFYFIKGKVVLPNMLWNISILSSLALVLIQPSGKTILFISISLIIALLVSKNRYKKIQSKYLYVMIMISIIIFSLFLINQIGINYGNKLFVYKYYQVTQLLVKLPLIINPKEYIYAIPPSSRIRVLEFFNISSEIMKNPIYMLFGKGMGGSFHDKAYEMFYAEGAYSIDQWEKNDFYAPHGTLNYVFLKFGLVGLFFLIYLIFLLYKKALNESYKYRIFLYVVLILGFSFMFGYSLKLAFLLGTILGNLINISKNRKDMILKNESDIGNVLSS